VRLLFEPSYLGSKKENSLKSNIKKIKKGALSAFII